MSARQDDDRKIGEIWHASRQLQRRMSQIGLGYEAFMHPGDASEEMAVEGVLYGLYRIVEEASSLSDGTKVQFPDVPWDAIRGMRNRLAHDYLGMSYGVVWEVVQNDVPALQRLCLAYCERWGVSIDVLAEPDEPYGGR